ncbi:ubiquinone/menaquinone biosynthesis methyltransferase [bacterium]|nr:ubiquinone/menaquinone biosynthesis methyltransferase [bacterium]
MNTDVKGLFSDIAPTYDLLNHLLSFSIDKRWRKKTINLIHPDKQSPLHALDLCAGTLDLTIEFLNQFSASTVTSLDFAAPMLEKGKPKLNEEQLSRTQILCADALNTGLPDSSYDVIFCGFGFRNLPNRTQAIKEMYRLLKPEGVVLILEFFKPTRLTTRLFHKTYGNVLLPTVGKLVSGNSEAYRYLHNSIDSFITTSEAIGLFKAGGFQNLEAKKLTLGIADIIRGVK